MLTFSFSGVSGKMTVKEPLTSGMVGREVAIELGSEWDGLTKTAVFIAGYVCRTVPLTGSVVTIPSEILRSPYKKLRVGVRGDNEDGTLVIPTIMAEGPFILPGADPDGDTGDAESIPTGGTADASDIAAGETAYSGGQLITGTLKTADALKQSGAAAGFYFETSSDGESFTGVSLRSSLISVTERTIVDGDTVVTLAAAGSEFGDAAAAHVLEGKSFTSASGFRVSGALAPADALTLSDAEVGFGFTTGSSGESRNFVTLKVTLPEDAESILLGPGSVVTLQALMSEFGTATKADVAAGKTFTSIAGVCVSGTMEV